MIAVSKAVIQETLALYRVGQIKAAREVLERAAGGDYVRGTHETEAEIMSKPITAAGAVSDWIQLALDRLRKETGENVIAVCPVAVALNTALDMMA